MNVRKVIRITLIAIAAVLALACAAYKIVTRPSVLSRIVSEFSKEFIPDGTLQFESIGTHMVRSFPNLEMEISGLSLTYPHERYQRFDSLYAPVGRRFDLLKAGNGENGTDTLLSARSISLSLNYIALAKGNYHVHRAILERPRIFAHFFDSTAANWDILPLGREKKDTSSKPLPSIKLDRIRLADKPVVVYTNPVDTLHARISMNRLQLEGHIDLENPVSSDATLEIDSLRASGRLPADTLAMRMDLLRMDIDENHLTAKAVASARMHTRNFGRLTVPFSIEADALLPQHEKGELGAVVNILKVGVSALVAEGTGTIWRRAGGDIDMDFAIAVNSCPLGDIIDEYRENFGFLKKLNTNAQVSLAASAKGTWGHGKNPKIDARVKIPSAVLDYEDLGRKGEIALDATVRTEDMEMVNANVKRLFVDFAGAKVNVSGKIADLLGEDPLLTLDGTVRARVDSLTSAFTRAKGIIGAGELDATLSGRTRLSQLNLAKIGGAGIDCRLIGKDLSIKMPADSLSAFIPRIDADLRTKGNEIDRQLKKGARVLALKLVADTLDVSIGEQFIRGGGIDAVMQNSADVLTGLGDRSSIMGRIKARNLGFRDSEGLAAGIRDNVERFRYEPANAQRPFPRLKLNAKFGRIGGILGKDAAGARNLTLDVTASRRIRRPGSAERRNRILDSLQRIYPDVPRDSLFRHARLSHIAVRSNDDFASADIKISLSETIRKYVRDWDLKGNLGLEGALLRLPAFPLRSSFSNVGGSFSNDTLSLDNITLKVGESDLSARARMSGLRMAIVGRGSARLKLTADVKSDVLNLDELRRGIAYYRNYNDSLSTIPSAKPDDLIEEAIDKSAEEAMEEIEEEIQKGALLIIPSNLDANIALEVSKILYNNLDVEWAAADIAIKDRTLQLTNAIAATNMGDMYLEGFYASRSKEDIKAGFDLNLVDITAEKVITLFPAVDSIMPMLKSFAGDLNCEFAATSAIDTSMNLILPSIDGVMRISGKNLSLKESGGLRTITDMLKFKDKESIIIDEMSVSGIIRNNVMEIFPFVLNVDRYQFAAAGTQLLDSNFNYHISVLKSPMILRFGVNAWGPDFDHVHFGVGKAKFKSANVPVYTKQLDDVKYSLVVAIHDIFEKGVQNAFDVNKNAAAGVSTTGNESAEPMLEEMADTEKLENLIMDVNQSVASRREALREEILNLEKKYYSR